jgi:hypothetical protein
VWEVVLFFPKDFVFLRDVVEDQGDGGGGTGRAKNVFTVLTEKHFQSLMMNGIERITGSES